MVQCRVPVLGQYDLLFLPLYDVEEKPCPGHIFYAISCMITKLGVVVNHGMVQRHSDLLYGKSKENLFRSISFVVVLT